MNRVLSFLVAAMALGYSAEVSAQSCFRPRTPAPGTVTKGRVLGDFDGATGEHVFGDIALTSGVSPGGVAWSTIPVAHSNGRDGTFTITNNATPPDLGPRSWFGPPRGIPFGTAALRPHARPLLGDFNGDGVSDIALVDELNYLPLVFGSSGGAFGTYGWFTAPSALVGWAHYDEAHPSTATPVAGDFDGDGRTDIALVGGWSGPSTPRSSILVTFSGGAGDFPRTIFAPAADFALYATQPNAMVVSGDFDANGCADIALTGGFSPGGIPWITIPVAFSNCDDTFRVENRSVADFPLYATQGALAVAGDFDGDGDADIALTGGRTPSGAPWTTIPVAFSRGDGQFDVTNWYSAEFPLYATQPGAQLVATDLDGDCVDDLALIGGFGWTTIPAAFSNSNGTFRVTNQTVAEFPTYATQSFSNPASSSNPFNLSHLPPNALSASYARRHSIQVSLTNVDDNGFVRQGSSAGPLLLEAHYSSGIPGSGSFDVGNFMRPQASRSDFAVHFDNNGCFWSDGTVRFIVDGVVVVEDGAGGARRICEGFFDRSYGVDLQFGTVVVRSP